MDRTPLVVGNWKMNGTRGEAKTLAQSIAMDAKNLTNVAIAICPPYVLLDIVAAALGDSAVALGAQSVSEFSNGAYTGEVSASMLSELGCRCVIVGHSERRQLFGESHEAIAAKAQSAMNAGLCPIICVGETLEERSSGSTEQVIAAQLEPVLQSAKAQQLLANAVIAYEPVWAIGTGQTASPAEAQNVHGFIRARLANVDSAAAASIQILYGGSVKPNNARELFSEADVDGGLIGGASLQAGDFLAICTAASEAHA